MTWMSTWPPKTGGPTAYREHATEAAAEAHATEVVWRGEASVATWFEMEST